MKNFIRKYILKNFLFIIIYLFSTTVCAYGQGEGMPGSSGVKPLSFVSCTLEDGSKIDAEDGITVEPKFILKFDKNIVNMLVWENNRKCFSLSTGGNVNIPIVVSKIDDTVDFDHRQDVFIKPVNALEFGKTYYIKVGPQLISKNGQSTIGSATGGKDLTISFKTKKQEITKDKENENNAVVTEQNMAEKGSEVRNLDEQKNENSKDGDSTVKANEESVIHNDGDKSVNQQIYLLGNMILNNWLAVIAGSLFICWIATEIFYEKKNRKERRNKL
ncbi:hypothetical protein CPJCM30710_19040 [Clostridium polyendosporum]|uniref:SbsA Ig-like domain-containing protein n=1 Tax=Clostridium polyendosporum TaxID=69208 RepID=A0A919VM57_9CLOT|nr:Ig-like domain-containing protein [Clostridium polyendosporum]GIM29238.1 hypothetical protein CPJCM30710_19040 [Clostridium polyendosporum]